MEPVTGAATDAIELLTSQHREVEALWSMLQSGGGASSALAHEQTREIVKLLSQHDAIETMFLYPAVRKAGGDQFADHSLAEHQQVRELLKQVDKGDPTDPETFSFLRQAIEAVQAHVAEEEGEIFPLLRAGCDQSELQALGEKLEAGMKTAPTHPHPTTPNNPVGAAVAGAVTGMVDRARDAISGDS
jgi:hemerythrin superfamily protein